MTANLHHINQMILQLPTVNGYVSAQAQAAEEAIRQERLFQAAQLHRDTVEIVSRLQDTTRVNPVHRDPDDRPQERYRPRFAKRRPREAKAPDPYLAPVESVVDRKI
ncbi:MAG: hypothetical protein LBF40_10000 [Deltaproteobacteria bacterium]|jgi:hypothetical protein|nr:hypothetical protein [Deltaproteobacteria bacterium]